MSNPFKNPYKRLTGHGMDREEAKRRMEEVELEKTDVPAMIIAAFLTIFPALLIIIGILVAVLWFLFMR
ncbi:MAG: hypothetical protein RR482_09580 [Clostridia bacterium]